MTTAGARQCGGEKKAGRKTVRKQQRESITEPMFTTLPTFMGGGKKKERDPENKTPANEERGQIRKMKEGRIGRRTFCQIEEGGFKKSEAGQRRKKG